ncbi:hypothetical protein BDZ89DRAFT_1216541 [Hymenopellis radicata]|nr:hypothetical protein BDZ89DRAFT_1216541 [Hymenopellis radicata]
MAQRDASLPKFYFDSTQGRLICRKLARPDLNYDPHDYSLDVGVKVLDGLDCVVRAACGSGKTGVMALLAILFKKLAADSSLYPPNPARPLVKDPIILVICPTNALEKDLEKKLCMFGIQAIAINAVLAEKVRIDPNADGDIWDLAKEATVILLSPADVNQANAATASIARFPYLQRTITLALRPRRSLTDKAMRDYLTKRLDDLRMVMFDDPEKPYTRHGLYTPDDIIPDSVIAIILDNVFALTSVDALAEFTKAHQLFRDWLERIFDEVRDSVPQLHTIHAATIDAVKKKKKEISDKGKEKRRDEREVRTGIRKH